MKTWMKRIALFASAALMTLGLSVAAMAANPEFIFTNDTDPASGTGDLFISKTVTAALEGYTIPDASFTFTLTWDPDGDGELTPASNVSYGLYTANGEEISGTYVTSLDGTFALKSGQYARFTNTGGIAYEVAETPVDHFLQTSPAGGQSAVGTISESGTTVSFTNLYVPTGGGGTGGEGDTTLLAVRKDIYLADGVSVPASLADSTFTFQVTVGGSFYADQAYTIYDSAMTVRQGSGVTDSEGRLTISPDQLAVFSDVPIGESYTVEEIPTEFWDVVGESSYSGTTADPIVYNYFTNTVGPGGFTVAKERADGITGSDGGTFTFTVTDADSVPMSDVTYYLYDTDGTVDSTGGSPVVHTTTDDGTFTLEAGQSAEFFGIDAGTSYKVTETDPTSGYSVEPAAGYSGTVVTSDDPEYVFTNTQLTSITIAKTDGGAVERRLSGAEFTLYRLADNGDPDNDADWTPYPNVEQATKVTSSDIDSVGELTFTDLPAGTYKILETKNPTGYAASGDPIVVTLPYTTTEEGVDGAVYSARDGLYYLYSFSYTVSNTATLVMPNAGGNAWIVFLFVVLGASIALVVALVCRDRFGKTAVVCREPAERPTSVSFYETACDRVSHFAINVDHKAHVKNHEL